MSILCKEALTTVSSGVTRIFRLGARRGQIYVLAIKRRSSGAEPPDVGIFFEFFQYISFKILNFFNIFILRHCFLQSFPISFAVYAIVALFNFLLSLVVYYLCFIDKP